MNNKRFILDHQVTEAELDFLGHVNNKAYLGWMEMVAWKHARSVGISREMQESLNRILAVYENHMQYHASCYLGDKLEIITWIGERQGCCKRLRHFEIIRQSDNKTVFTATATYVCIDLKTHQPKRIPNEFIDSYLST
jgi:acyl-CoA thioester hydrolase